ncbi:MAG: T9SS type A sorting domain-containing protein [Aureispira sp.]
MTSKANEVIFSYRNDTTNNNWDSIAVWIGNKVGLSAEYELIEHYWSGTKYEEALNHLSTIADMYTLEDVVLNNHQEYEALLNMLYTAYQADRTEATLTKDEVILLNELTENNNGFAAMKAANIIDFFYSDTYRYHPTLPAATEGKSIQSNLVKIQKGNLSIYPNPTTDWADVTYKFPENIKEGRLVITSTAGQHVMNIIIQQEQGVLTLNTSQWLTGTYFVILYTENEVVEQTQLIIRK